MTMPTWPCLVRKACWSIHPHTGTCSFRAPAARWFLARSRSLSTSRLPHRADDENGPGGPLQRVVASPELVRGEDNGEHLRVFAGDDPRRDDEHHEHEQRPAEAVELVQGDEAEQDRELEEGRIDATDRAPLVEVLVDVRDPSAHPQRS